MRKIIATIALLFIGVLCALNGIICVKLIQEFIEISENVRFTIYLTVSFFMAIGPFGHVFSNILEELKK